MHPATAACDVSKSSDADTTVRKGNWRIVQQCQHLLRPSALPSVLPMQEHVTADAYTLLSHSIVTSSRGASKQGGLLPKNHTLHPSCPLLPTNQPSPCVSASPQRDFLSLQPAPIDPQHSSSTCSCCCHKAPRYSCCCCTQPRGQGPWQQRCWAGVC